MKDKRGRGAFGKTVVFGIHERGGKVYTEIVDDASKSTLQGIIREKVDAKSAINSDGWRGYNGLVDFYYFDQLILALQGLIFGYGHFRVDDSKDEFARGHTHINGIEGFWGFGAVHAVMNDPADYSSDQTGKAQAKVRLAKFKGVPKSTFQLHLKESEFRYNMRHENMTRLLLKICRNKPLS